ncbi:MAG TPA: MFS transporter, partial [Bacteroidales bacterium]|nr:MFS transporter [Bacteroidales bacterium]
MPERGIERISGKEVKPKNSHLISVQLLNESPTITRQHYRILIMSWAGWVFDFYDLILFTFLLIPISQEYGFSNLQMSYILGSTLAATAIGGVIFGMLSDRFGRKAVLQWTILTYSLGTFFSGLAGNFEVDPEAVLA